MKTIIVATDFSADAANAVQYAADMALATHAHLLLFHVCQLPLSYSEIPLVADPDEMFTAAENEVKELKKYVEKQTNGRLYISTEVSMGFFFEELEAVCARVSPYVVVIGAQGKTALERVFFGSQAVHTMKELKWPVIAVPSGISFTEVKKIGLACDLDDVVESIPVDEIKLLINDFHAELHIINSGKRTEFRPGEVFESALLQELLNSLNPVFHFITDKSGDDAILEFAEENKLDLLIIFPKHHSIIEKLVYKSHTRALVLHSHVPVMALHN